MLLHVSLVYLSLSLSLSLNPKPSLSLNPKPSLSLSTFFSFFLYLLALPTKARILCLDSLYGVEKLLFYHTPLIVVLAFIGFCPPPLERE